MGSNCFARSKCEIASSDRAKCVRTMPRPDCALKHPQCDFNTWRSSARAGSYCFNCKNVAARLSLATTDSGLIFTASTRQQSRAPAAEPCCKEYGRIERDQRQGRAPIAARYEAKSYDQNGGRQTRQVTSKCRHDAPIVCGPAKRGAPYCRFITKIPATW